MSATIEARTLITDGDPDDRYPIPEDKTFELVDEETKVVTPVEYLYAPELEPIARALAETHASLNHLEMARVAYLWKREGGKKKGGLTFGQCQKPSGLLKYYSAVDYVVWLAADHCRASLFTRWQVEALLFHELKHTRLKVNDEGAFFVLQGHDWEGFVEEVAYYQDWRPDMTQLKSAFGLQGHLFAMRDEE